MPKSYNTLVTAIETLNPKLLNVDFVKSRLLDEYGKRNVGNKYENIKSSEAGAMTAFQFKCHNCGKVGHKKWECPGLEYRKIEEANGNEKRANIAEVMMMTSCNILFPKK